MLSQFSSSYAVSDGRIKRRMRRLEEQFLLWVVISIRPYGDIGAQTPATVMGEE